MNALRGLVGISIRRTNYAGRFLCALLLAAFASLQVVKDVRLDGCVKDWPLAPQDPVGNSPKKHSKEQKKAQVAPIGKLVSVNYREGDAEMKKLGHAQ